MSDPTYRLLRELAGRVDDDLLATGRELVAVGEEGHALELLVAELVAGRAVLPYAVRSELVAEAAARRVQPDADACLPPAADVAAGPHRFDGDGPPGAAEAIAAALAGVPVPESGWTLAWRRTPAGSAPGPLPQPVLLARTGPHGAPEVLTYQAQSALARAGLVVSVEVGDDLPDPGYHRAAREVARPLPAAPVSDGAAPPRDDTATRHREDTAAPSRGEAAAPSRDDGSAEGVLPTAARSHRVPDDRATDRAGLLSPAIPPVPRSDRDELPAVPGPGDVEDAPAGHRTTGSPRDLSVSPSVGSSVSPSVDTDGVAPAPPQAPDRIDDPATPTGGRSTATPEPEARAGVADTAPSPDGVAAAAPAPGAAGPDARPDRIPGTAASGTGPDPAPAPAPAPEAEADTPHSGADPVPEPGGGRPAPAERTLLTGAGQAQDAESSSTGTGHAPGVDTTRHGSSASASDATGSDPQTGGSDGAGPGPAGFRGPAARRGATPTEREDTAHPAPRPSPPIRALREASAGDWFDSPPDGDAPDPTPPSGVGEVPRHPFVADHATAGNGHDANGAHPTTAGRGPVAGPPHRRPAGPAAAPSGRPSAPSEGPPPHTVVPATPGIPAHPVVSSPPAAAVSPAAAVPPVVPADPVPTGFRPVPRDLGVPLRRRSGEDRAAAGGGPGPVVGRPPVGPPAAPGPDEASWLADWASGAWAGEIPPPEAAVPTDRSDVEGTVPGVPHVVPAATATVDDDRRDGPAHPAPGVTTGEADTVDEASTPSPGVPILRAPVPPVPADGERRPRHLLLTDDEPDGWDATGPGGAGEDGAEDPTEPADVVAPAAATGHPAPAVEHPGRAATGLPAPGPAEEPAAGPADEPAPRPRPRPRPAGGLADRLTPTEQDLLQRLHEELAARENGGEPTPRNGTARTDRG